MHVHHLRERECEHLGDPPRATIEWATVRAASWAHSDRAATTLIAMAVQQRLTTGERLGQILQIAPAMRRIGLVRQVISDVRGGAQALSEIDYLDAALRDNSLILDGTRTAAARLAAIAKLPDRTRAIERVHSGNSAVVSA